jgi:hypothetical protein
VCTRLPVLGTVAAAAKKKTPSDGERKEDVDHGVHAIEDEQL